MLLDGETLGAIGSEAATSGSREMNIVGDGTSRMEVTRGEGAPRADSTTGEEAAPHRQNGYCGHTDVYRVGLNGTSGLRMALTPV